MTRSFKSTITSTVAAAAMIAALAGSALADGLSARINASQVAQGDTFQLILSTDGQGGAAPDLSPLDQDFDVLGTSQSSQTQIINGRMSQSLSWIVTLSPRETGTVTIPELHAGALSSDPISVQVVDASQLPKLQGASGIAVSADIEAGSHYVFQEIPLTVRIESSAPLQRAELIAPQGEFELTQTGQDRTSQITRNGRPVTLIERSYLLRPQSEGALTIPPFTLRGTIRDPNTRTDPFGGGFGSDRMQQMMERMGMGGFGGGMFDDMFNPGQPFAARSDAITLDVLANPNASASGDWFLPAKAVELQADWLPETPTFREGEAVTRRVRLMALGARPEQLPDITFPEPDGARIYLDDMSTDMVETENGTVAQRVFTLSVVPTRGGKITLPEIAVDWMNTTTDQSQTARLPALTITSAGTLPVDALPPSVNAPVDAPTTKPAAHDPTPRDGWLWGLLAGLAGVAALSGIVWIKRRRISTEAPENQAAASMPDPMETLRHAVKRKDSGTFYTALLALRAAPDGYDKKEIDAVLTELDHQIFAQTATSTTPLDLDALLTRLQHKRRGKRKAARATKLPELYPVP